VGPSITKADRDREILALWLQRPKEHGRIGIEMTDFCLWLELNRPELLDPAIWGDPFPHVKALLSRHPGAGT
jgi:hypothetical protein